MINNSSRDSRPGEAGFSLIELLASTMLLVIGMLFFASLFGATMAAFVKTENTRVGKTYAETGMGEIATRARYLNITATQSTTDFDSPADLAVDGNRDGNWYNGSVTHTGYESQPWWQVDLGSSKQIEKVDVYLMTVCCSSHSNFDVKVSLDGTTWQSYYVAGPVDFISVPVNRKGRYVRVQLRDAYYLALAEVEVPGINLSATQQGVPDGGTITPGATCVAPYCDRIYQPTRNGATLPPPRAIPPGGTVPSDAQLLFIRRYTVRTVDAATNVREITMTLATTTSTDPFLTRTTRVLANK